ncbi:MAG TPA: tetratricopeptide repeat protein [Terriglobales bacterium]|nr:tetratricopeptide repeat protein [Terriglobales bacterium]
MLRPHSLGLIAFVLFSVPLFCQSSKQQGDAISSALRAKDFDKAIELSRASLRQFPTDPQLWVLQGVAMVNKGENQNALVSFRHALRLSPDYIAALAGAAQIEYQNGSRDAVPLLEHLLRLRPMDPTGHAMLAVLEYREGNCKAAVEHFERTQKLLDSELDAQHAYGACLVRLSRFDAAVDVFQRTLTLTGEDMRERQVLASVQLMARKPQDAIATLKPLLSNDNADASTLELASSAYEDAGDTPSAVSHLRQAILRDPKDVNLYLDFASLCMTHQSFQVGIDVISDGLAVQPNSARLYLARGVLYVQLAEYDKAEADFGRAHDLDPTESLSAAAQGLAAAQQNDFDRALSAVQKKLVRTPNDPYLLYLQADFLSQKGVDSGTAEFQQAMKSAKKAVSLQPSLAGARSVLAKLYMQSGQYQEAITQCKKALESDPSDQTTLYRLIQALRKTDKQAEIPPLLKRLASLREKATQDERERYRYKLVEENPTAQQSRP